MSRSEKYFWPLRAALLLALSAASLARAIQSVADTAPSSLIGNLPIYFEANRGQADGQFKFLARGQSAQFLVAPTEATLTFIKADSPPTGHRETRALNATQTAIQSRTVRLEFLGADSRATMTGEGELPGHVNYLLGNDPAQWHANVPTFTHLRVNEIYPGVSLVYYGNQQRLEYDFTIAPRADASAIAIRFHGADKLRVDERGDLVLTLGANEIRQPKPVIYQDTPHGRKEVAGGYLLVDRSTVKFKLGKYDRNLPLVIDPFLAYSTYFGGSALDIAWAVAVDTTGIYLAGETRSLTLPTTSGVLQSTNAGVTSGGGDAFVAKFDLAGTNLIYLTYLGGKTDDGALALALDNAGNAYLTGYTDSTNFPLASAIYTNISGTSSPALHIFPVDAFVSALNANGSALLFSTYLGGTNIDEGIGIAVDGSGANIYVAGYTESTNFPTANTTRTNYGTHGDAFVARIQPASSTLVYSMYLGGTNQEFGNDIAVDAAGNAFVTGYTSSTNFPITTNAWQSILNQTNTTFTDVFLTEVGPGGDLVYSTFVGGRQGDFGYRLTLDGQNNVYITGSTFSPNFPNMTNVASSVVAGGSFSDAFVTKFTNGVPAWSVVFGGSATDEGWDVAVDSIGHVHVVGSTTSGNFPTLHPTFFLRGTNFGSTDAFVMEFDNAGALLNSGYLGGKNADLAYGVAVDAARNVYVVGETSSTDFPTISAWQDTFGGTKDAFLAKIIPDQTLSIAAASTNVLLYWPNLTPESGDLRLQSKTNIATTNGWIDLPDVPVSSNGVLSITLPATNSTEFFRLNLP